MSAATARRNYTSTTQTQTIPAYPTPISSAGGSSKGVSASSRPQQAAYAPQRTAGESWSVQHDGNRQVIVIEDTPPPTSSTSSNVRAAPAAQSSTTNPAKKARYNGAYSNNGNNSPYVSTGLPPQASYQVNQLAGSSSWAVPPPATVRNPVQVSSSKRKYNEVNDPSTAVS